MRGFRLGYNGKILFIGVTFSAKVSQKPFGKGKTLLFSLYKKRAKRSVQAFPHGRLAEGLFLTRKSLCIGMVPPHSLFQSLCACTAEPFFSFSMGLCHKSPWGLNKTVGISVVLLAHRAEGKAAARSEFPKNRVTSESVPPLSARGQRASRVLAEFAGFRDKIHPMPAIQRHVGTLLFATFSFVQRKS